MIDEILANFAQRYPCTWPAALLDRFVYLARIDNMSEAHEAEYIAIRDWILETVERGIAFRQESLVEH